MARERLAQDWNCFSRLGWQPKITPEQLDLDHFQLDLGFDFLDQARSLPAFAPLVG